MTPLTLDEYIDWWWEKHGPSLENNELAQNGQFDELPYVEYEDVYLPSLRT